MSQKNKALTFGRLHRKGDPVVLYNIWDAGSARVIVEAGAPCVATGSWSVAAAQGFADGEKIPVGLLTTIAGRIVESCDVPVSLDIEGGYGVRPDQVAKTARAVIKAGIAGVNFEDKIHGGLGLYAMKGQAARISAIREAADEAEVPLFINARTDCFLQQPDKGKHKDLLEEALERAACYREAGGSGLFIPGLIDRDLIAEVCDRADMPVNVMMMMDPPPLPVLAEIGVARVSYGPVPYMGMVEGLEKQYRAILA
jgi:2-methylisocitrate lyase-like PEP mutase family enzyme